MLISKCCDSIPWNDTDICAECREHADFIELDPFFTFAKHKYYNAKYHREYLKAERKIKEKQNEQ